MSNNKDNKELIKLTLFNTRIKNKIIIILKRRIYFILKK